MSKRPDIVAEIEAKWQSEHAAYPGMEKGTFVRNHMFGGDFALSDIGRWAVTQDDLHGQLFESGFTSFSHFKPTGELAENGQPWITADVSKPHVACRVLLEVVTDGEARRLFPKAPWERADW